MTEIKDIIDKLIHQNASVSGFLEDNSLGQGDTDSDGLIRQYKNFIVDSNYNIGTGLRFGLILQLANDEEIIRQYELSDIERLFDSLIETQTDNLDNYIEAAHFQYNVLDNKVKAKEILNKGLAVANAKRKELQDLLNNI